MIPRFLSDNLAQRAETVLSVSSEQLALPRVWAQDPLRFMPWRSKLGWNVTAENDAISYNEGGDEMVAFLARGNYASGDDYATAAQVALNSNRGLDPSALGSLAAWYRADKGLTVDADGNVLAWADQSGNGYDLSVGTGSPTFLPDAINGRPAVVLDGLTQNEINFQSDGSIFANLFDGSGDGTVIMVVRTPAAQEAAAFRTYFGGSAANSNLGRVNSGVSTYTCSTHDGVATRSTSKAITHDTVQVLLFQRDADTTIFAGVDDLDTAALASSATLVGAGGNPAGSLRIGLVSGANATTAFGWIAEMVFWAGSLTEGQRQAIVSYLKAKYELATDTTAATFTNTYSGAYGATTNKHTLARSAGGDTINFEWNTGSHAEIDAGEDLGFDTSADDTGAVTYTADSVSYHSREWLTFDLGSALGAAAACVVGHLALAAGGEIRLQGNSRDVWDSPTVDVVLDGDDWLRVRLFDQTAFRYWRFTINDVQNTLGYSQLGVPFVGGEGYVLSRGVRFGFTDAPKAQSLVSRGADGAWFQGKKRAPRAWQLSFAGLVDADKAALQEIQDAVEVGGHLYLCLDPSNPTASTRYGVLSAGISWTHQVNDEDPPMGWATQVSFEEEVQ